MVDVETAEIGAAMLATAIGELMEDHAALAVVKPTDGLAGYGALADQLVSATTDMAMLAQALQILIRRAGAAP